MGMEEYLEISIEIIKEFDKIAPYEKYSGGNEIEMAFLMKDIRDSSQTEKNEEEEYKNYMLYLLENSNGMIDLEDAYDFMKVLHVYSKDGKDVALKEFDLLFKKIIESSNPAITISKISFLLGVLNSNEIIDVNEMNKLADKYQNECLNLIMKDKK
jgi:hypothetical protein